MSYNNKKFLDANGVTQIVGLLDNYATNETLSTVVNAIDGAISAKYTKPEGGIPPTDLANGVLPNMDTKADIIVNSAEGNPIVISDGGNNLPVQSMIINFAPVQTAGTPSSTNPIEISGWTGLDVHHTLKNLTNIKQLISAPGGTFEGFVFKHILKIKVKPNTDYTLSSTSSGALNVLYFNGTNSQYVGVNASNPRTQNSGSSGILTLLLYDRENIADYENETIQIQLEEGTSATEIKLTDDHIYPITWSSYGTVYGGYIDLTTGKVWKTYDILDLDIVRFYKVKDGVFASYALVPEYADRTKFMCNVYEVVSYTYWDDMTDKTIMGITPGNTIRIMDTDIEDADALYAHLTQIGAKLAYTLAEPVLIATLNPIELRTLLGTNIIWSNTNGSIKISYSSDTKKYADLYVGVKDVKVNGTSVTQDKVANIPKVDGTNITTGVVSLINYEAGLCVMPSTGRLSVVTADSQIIKTGTNLYRSLIPARQHESVFYGLAKVAGADMASSDNAVGTYTDAAKQGIQKLFGFEDILGNYESSTTASKAYTVGETFIFDGKRYRVTANIAQNYIIAPGTNCELDPLNGRLVKVSSIGPGLFVASNGQIVTNRAAGNTIKQGTTEYTPIDPAHQHESVFYGLAKAANADLKNVQDVTIGVYPQTQKTAIQNMLGIEASIPLIEEVSGSTPTIVGIPNVRYICGEVSLLTITPPAAGSIVVRFSTGSSTTLTVPNTVKWPAWFDATNLDTDTTYEIIITDGVYGGVMSWA